MAVRERVAVLASKDCKIIDDKYWHFGTKSGRADFADYDRRIGYNSTDLCLDVDCVREAAAGATQQYARGFRVAGDSFFTGTGVQKSWLMLIAGDRDSAVMGGDSNDMLLKVDYTNYAVNTPAGSYARGASFQINNRTTGAITSLEGMFIGVRQRSTGAVGTLEGLQIDCKVDASMTAISSELTGARVEFDVCANAPSASYGFVARNRTDGVYTAPMAAFKAINDATSSCVGWQYGVDLMSAAGVKTVQHADIRFSQQDGNNLQSGMWIGTATDDTSIVADVGADSTIADGSLYVSIVDGGGLLFQKRNDTWTSI